MRKTSAILLALILLTLASAAWAEDAVTDIAQLNRAGMKVGVNTGSASSLIAEKAFPTTLQKLRTT